nr:MAG: hypothetical protein DIU70_10100 [Bacillota bacterium]
MAVGWFGEALIFGFLLPYLQNPARDGRWALYGYSLAVAILAVVASLCTTVFGPELTARLSYPTYALVQQIRIGEFLERTEIVLVGIWIMGMFVKVGLCLLAAGLAARHSAGIPFTPWSVAAQVIAALALTQLWPSFNSQASWAVSGLTPTVLPIQLGIPLLLLAVGGLRGWPVPKRNRKDRASHELG